MNDRNFPPKISRCLRPAAQRFFCSALALAVPLLARAEESLVTAVASKAAPDYIRTRLANGTFQAEGYSFGNGGYVGGGMSDETIDKTKFLDVAKVIAGPLRTQSYVPSTDAKATKLLIMVYWGTTNPPGPAGQTIAFQNASSAMSALQQAKQMTMPPPGASAAISGARGTSLGPPDAENAATAAIAMLQAQNAQRRRQDVMTAKMLGYDSWWEATSKFEGTPLDTERNDMLDELEEGRYFVVLMAYDFQLLLKEKKHKLLWETRFSVRQHRNDFGLALADMTKFASRYFGQDSHGLVHKPPHETFRLGDLKVIEVVPDK